MDIDIVTSERLLSAIRLNQVVLFLGSGFSRGAQNRLHKEIPDGRGLAQALWEYLEYREPYDGSDLQTVFSAAMNSAKGHKALGSFLEDHLLCGSIPSWYDTISRIFWYRVYTTNIDDLVEQVFGRSNRVANLDKVIATTEDYRDRDQFLYNVQYIKLHGTIPGPLKNITFSWRQYGQRLGAHDPWYDHFVRDYCTRMTILVGTELNEPWFWQHIESRDRRTPRQSEHRPDAFLVCPTISPAKENSLRDMNVIGVRATAEEFFTWVQSNIKELPIRERTLAESRPELRVAFEQAKGTLTRKEIARVEQFYEVIHPVRLPSPNASHRKLYLLGSSPGWQDFAHNLDAPRDINHFLAETIREAYGKPSPLPIALLGSAGCGKSTILRRVALTIAAEGHPVFFSEADVLPRPDDAAAVLNDLDRPAILFLDNADLVLNWCGALLQRCEESRRPLLVLAARTNRYDRYCAEIRSITEVTEIAVPHLSSSDIEALIQVLERNNLLGHLRGMSERDRCREFEKRAEKQLLIAMREATEGRGFDQIIESEFAELTPIEAKVLYLCAAIATTARSYLTIDQLLSCAEVSRTEALELVNRNLRDIVIRLEEDPRSMRLRHTVIAELMTEKRAPRNILQEAYIRLLSALSHDMGRPLERNSRVARLYRRIINHEGICRRFEVEDARVIYESLEDRFKEEAHFWLQFASLELTQGDLGLAGNYIAQAESLSPSDDFIRMAKAHLWLKKAVVAASLREARQLWSDARDLVLEQISKRGKTDPYPYHIFGSQVLEFANRLIYKEEQKSVLEDGTKIVSSGVKNHPRNPELQELEGQLRNAYMALALA